MVLSLLVKATYCGKEESFESFNIGNKFISIYGLYMNNFLTFCILLGNYSSVGTEI